MKLMKTGIAGLDEFLQGGLAPGVFLLIGSPESGSEIFARQLSYYRATNSQVSYFTLAKDPESIRQEMALYGWDTASLEREKRWRFIKPQKTERLMDEVKSEIALHRSIVVDSLSELILENQNENTTKLLTEMSLANMKTQEAHLLLLTQGMQDPKIEVASQHFADGIIELKTSWEGENVLRYLTLRKTTGTLLPSRRLPYVLGKKGFTVETATRIT